MDFQKMKKQEAAARRERTKRNKELSEREAKSAKVIKKSALLRQALDGIDRQTAEGAYQASKLELTAMIDSDSQTAEAREANHARGLYEECVRLYQTITRPNTELQKEKNVLGKMKAAGHKVTLANVRYHLAIYRADMATRAEVEAILATRRNGRLSED